MAVGIQFPDGKSWVHWRNPGPTMNPNEAMSFESAEEAYQWALKNGYIMQPARQPFYDREPEPRG